jgi:hypothetical protein
MLSFLRKRHLSTQGKFLFLIAFICSHLKATSYFILFFDEMRCSHSRQVNEVRLSFRSTINQKLFSTPVSLDQQVKLGVSVLTRSFSVR